MIRLKQFLTGRYESVWKAKKTCCSQLDMSSKIIRALGIFKEKNGIEYILGRIMCVPWNSVWSVETKYSMFCVINVIGLY